MNMQLEDRIREIVEEHFMGTEGFLVDVKTGGSKKIQVFIDFMNQNVTVEKCVRLSRLLEEKLEAEGWVGEKYTLDVSSPGMENPFKVQQQYVKNIGRHVEVLLLDGVKVAGILTKVDEKKIDIEEHVVKKRKAPEIIKHQFHFDEIKRVNKVITF